MLNVIFQKDHFIACLGLAWKRPAQDWISGIKSRIENRKSFVAIILSFWHESLRTKFHKFSQFFELQIKLILPWLPRYWVPPSVNRVLSLIFVKIRDSGRHRRIGLLQPDVLDENSITYVRQRFVLSTINFRFVNLWYYQSMRTLLFRKRLTNE